MGSEPKKGPNSEKERYLELDQGFVEMVESMVGDIGTMSRSIYHMGNAIGRMTDLMEIWMAEQRNGRTEEVRKVDEETQTETEKTEEKGTDTEEDVEETGKKNNGEGTEKGGDDEDMEMEE